MWDANHMASTMRAIRPPVPLAYEVLLRRDDQEWPIGFVSFKVGTTGNSGARKSLEYFTFDVADVVLRPSAEATARTVDLTDYYNHELVFKDIPVEKP
jgi:hypothetical protein